MLTSRRSAVSNVDEVFCERDLSLVAVHKFRREVFRYTKNDVWSFAALHPSRTTEQPSFRERAAFMKFYICARI